MPCNAGTEKINGYWATLRREVGRVPVNTGGTSDSKEQKYLHSLVRVHQWRYWNKGADCFKLMGGVIRGKRVQDSVRVDEDRSPFDVEF
eukprot:7779839-Heterocapsa_arctica.AAC.1